MCNINSFYAALSAITYSTQDFHPKRHINLADLIKPNLYCNKSNKPNKIPVDMT